MQNARVTKCNPLLDEVKIDLNMLRPLVLNRIGGHVDGADVVTTLQSGSVEGSVQLLEELSQPGSFCHSIGNGAILSFGAGA